MRAHPDQLEVRNAVRTTVVPYGALKAKHDIDVAVGLTETQTDTANVGVEVNEMLKGYKISSSVSVSVSRSINGPADNTQVRAGVYATHRAGYAVLFGRIERYTYDLYYTYTGSYTPTMRLFLSAIRMRYTIRSWFPVARRLTSGIPDIPRAIRFPQGKPA